MGGHAKVGVQRSSSYASDPRQPIGKVVAKYRVFTSCACCGDDAPRPPRQVPVISLRVLIADDSHDSADSVAFLVRLWGHAVRIAYGSMEALAIALEFQPHMVLADLVMPGFDGNELARQLRKTLGPWPVLVAVTGHGLEQDYRESEAAGFDHLMLKPADPEAIEVLLAYTQGRFRENW